MQQTGKNHYTQRLEKRIAGQIGLRLLLIIVLFLFGIRMGISQCNGALSLADKHGMSLTTNSYTTDSTFE